jgi:hypothetical protein
MFRRFLAVTAVALVALTACSAGSEPDPGAQATGATGSSSADDLTDPIVAGGGAAGLNSCAFAFSAETLAERGFAFDGTVSDIVEPTAQDAPYEVVFDVTTWYRGDEGSSVTVKTYDVSGTSLAGDLGLEPGERILGSGDDGFLWGCGFSMPYTDRDAAVFEDVFGA